MDCEDFSCSKSFNEDVLAYCDDGNTETDCSDGYDNDQDGFIDCNDFDCSESTPCSGEGEGSTEPDECLYSNVTESCVATFCLSTLNECFATEECSQGFFCLLNCEQENLDQSIWGAPILLQGLAACMQAYCL